MMTVVRELPAGQSAAVISQRRALVAIGVPLQRRAAGAFVECTFGPRQLVGYRLRLNERERLFVFRTLAQPDASCTKIPGVCPHVQLLLCAHTGRRIHRALRILKSAQARGRDLSRLSDSFFLRAGTTLAGRAPVESVVNSLLLQEEHSRWTC